MADSYKIVTATKKTTKQKIRELREYLAASIAVNAADGELEQAGLFQQRLDIFELMVKRAQQQVEPDGRYRMRGIHTANHDDFPPSVGYSEL